MTFSSEMTLLQLFMHGIYDKAHSVGHTGRDRLADTPVAVELAQGWAGRAPLPGHFSKGHLRLRQVTSVSPPLTQF